jgi:hypothetical protein
VITLDALCMPYNSQTLRVRLCDFDVAEHVGAMTWCTWGLCAIVPKQCQPNASKLVRFIRAPVNALSVVLWELLVPGLQLLSVGCNRRLRLQIACDSAPRALHQLLDLLDETLTADLERRPALHSMPYRGECVC